MFFSSGNSLRKGRAGVGQVVLPCPPFLLAIPVFNLCADLWHRVGHGIVVGAPEGVVDRPGGKVMLFKLEDSSVVCL